MVEEFGEKSTIDTIHEGGESGAIPRKDSKDLLFQTLTSEDTREINLEGLNMIIENYFGKNEFGENYFVIKSIKEVEPFIRDCGDLLFLMLLQDIHGQKHHLSKLIEEKLSFHFSELKDKKDIGLIFKITPLERYSINYEVKKHLFW